MRFLAGLLLTVALQLPPAASAQQITVSGWVDRVDTRNATITLRTWTNPRTIRVVPDAIIRINGAVARMALIPLNSEATILAARGPNGVLRAVQISVTGNGYRVAAVAPPGSVLTGTLVGMNIPANQITLRTQAGDFSVPLGSAPILINGRRGNTRSLRVGQLIHVERTLPTEGSTDYVTQVVRILGRAAAAPTAPAEGTAPVDTRAGRSAAPAASGTPRRPARSGVRVSRYPAVAVRVDGSELTTAGLLVNGRALLPVRELVRQLGGRTVWEPGARTVWVSFPEQGRTVRMAAGSPVALTYTYKADDPHWAGRLLQVTGLDPSPMLLGGQLLAPAAPVTEIAGATLEFRPESRQVLVMTEARNTTARR